MTKKLIPGVIETKKKTKPIAPVYTYEVDFGKAKPLIVQANRVDQLGETLTFIIEYTDHNLFVAGFSKWKSFRILEKEEPLKKLLTKAKKIKPLKKTK